MKKTGMTFAALMLVSAAAFADTTYDNTGSVSGSIESFGYPNTATYGETFQAPSDSTLQSFSLFLNAPDVGTISSDLQGYVGTWTGSSVGAILYSSPLTAVTGQNQEFTFSPDISVTGGDE